MLSLLRGRVKRKTAAGCDFCGKCDYFIDTAAGTRQRVGTEAPATMENDPAQPDGYSCSTAAPAAEPVGSYPAAPAPNVTEIEFLDPPFSSDQPADAEAAPDKLTASEALYGFACWLTCRKERTVMSSTDDAAPIATLVATFVKENGLSAPREGWAHNLIHPSG